MEALEQAALNLSEEDRLCLIGSLWDSPVDDRGDQLQITPQMCAELDRRLEAHRRDSSNTLTCSQVKQQVRSSS